MQRTIERFGLIATLLMIAGGSVASGADPSVSSDGAGAHHEVTSITESLTGRRVWTRVAGVPRFNGPDSGFVKSWRLIDVDQNALFGAEAFARQSAGEPIVLELSDTKSVQFRGSLTDLSLGETPTWYGEMEGAPEGYALFTRVGDSIAGKVQLPGGELYEILDAGDGLAVVRLIDDLAQPGCGNTHAHRVIQAPPEPGQEIEPGLHGLDDSGETVGFGDDRGSFIFVDVLVLYTIDARLAAGSVAAIESQLNLAFADSNLAYQTSGVTMRIRPAALVETNYTQQSTLSADLSALAGVGDGQLEEAHSLRSTFSADIVALLTANASGGACGVGYLMTNVSSLFSPNAFSVTARTCLSNQTFAHELGHNMGCAHDRQNSSGPGAFSYSFGHRDSGAQYRSVMSYAPGTRVRQFSNPSVNFPNGQPSGVEISSPSSAHNAMGLELAAPTIAAWRVLYQSPPGSFNLLTPAASALVPSRNVTFTWASAPETDYYRIIVDNDPNFMNPEVDYEPLTTNSYTTPHNTLAMGTTYYWKVIANNPLGSATSSPAIRQFTTPSTPPSAFALTLPANGAPSASVYTSFTWQPAINADSYAIVVDDNSDFSSPHISASGVLNPSYSAALTPLNPNTTYYWKVTATNVFGAVVASPGTSSFGTIGAPPTAFNLVSPADGPNVPTTTPTLVWSASDFADSYELIVDDSISLLSPEFHATGLTQTSLSIPAATLSSGVRYYWRVIAHNPIGTTTSSPATISFGVLLPVCLGDGNSDRVVNFSDITSVLSNWGTSGPGGDTNNTGTVDFSDITSVLSNWGAKCPQ